MLKRARDVWEILDRIPNLSRLKMVENHKRVDYFTEDDLSKLMDYLNEKGKTLESYRTMAEVVTVLLHTGARRNEILNLHSNNVDLNEKIIHLVDTKNGRDRAVPLTDEVCEILKSRVTKAQVFGDMHYENFESIWRRARKAIGAEGRTFKPHMLRHTCATRLVTAGLKTLTVMDWLGHTTPAMTNRYTHLDLDHLRHARDVMQDKFLK